MNTEQFYKLSHLFLSWNISNKTQRFGQYVESNSNWVVGTELYMSEDSFHVYSEIVTLIEKGELV